MVMAWASPTSQSFAAMCDLVHKEAFNEMHKVYSVVRLPTVGAVTQFWSE